MSVKTCDFAAYFTVCSKANHTEDIKTLHHIPLCWYHRVYEKSIRRSIPFLLSFLHHISCFNSIWYLCSLIATRFLHMLTTHIMNRTSVLRRHWNIIDEIHSISHKRCTQFRCFFILLCCSHGEIHGGLFQWHWSNRIFALVPVAIIPTNMAKSNSS